MQALSLGRREEGAKSERPNGHGRRHSAPESPEEARNPEESPEEPESPIPSSPAWVSSVPTVPAMPTVSIHTWSSRVPVKPMKRMYELSGVG